METEIYGINPTKRLTVETAEAELYKPKTFLNDHFVRLVDYVGGDEAVVRGATAGKGLDLFKEDISAEDLFYYLRMNHITEPFRFPELKMHFKVPIQEALFWVYQRSSRINEWSGRYSEMSDEAREYTEDDFSYLHVLDETRDKIPEILDLFEKTRLQSKDAYKNMLSEGFVRELARIGIGIGNNTEFYLTMNLEDLLIATKTAFYNSINYDIKKTADSVLDLAASVAPLAVKSFLTPQNQGLDWTIDRDVLEEKPSGNRFEISQTKRLVVPEAEKMLFKPIDILDHGWVMPTDYMGTDSSIVQAARVSYSKGTTSVRQDKTLIRYLLRHLHTSPFEQVSVQYEMKTPIFVSPRQAARHRTAVKGYLMDNMPVSKDFYIPEIEQIRGQSKTNMQGRGSELDDETKVRIIKELDSTFSSQAKLRSELSNTNIPDYMVDAQLGVGHYTWTTWKQDLHNVFHFLRLRDDSHAQHEIQVTARAMGEFVESTFPISHEAFLDYTKNAVSFSSQEQELLARMIAENRSAVPNHFYKDMGWWLKKDDKKNLEAIELDNKIETLMKK
jgi:thymidylate synthase (FAD)